MGFARGFLKLRKHLPTDPRAGVFPRYPCRQSCTVFTPCGVLFFSVDPPEEKLESATGLRSRAVQAYARGGGGEGIH